MCERLNVAPRPGRSQGGGIFLRRKTLNHGTNHLMTEQREVDPIACFLTACEIERREHRTARREHKVVNGRRILADGDRFFYAFEASPDIALKDDTSVQLVVGGASYHGTVHHGAVYHNTVHHDAVHSGTDQARIPQSSILNSQRQGPVAALRRDTEAFAGGRQRITIALTCDLGAEIPKARLDSQEHDLLQALIFRLKAQQQQPDAEGWNSELAHRVLSVPDGAEPTTLSSEKRKLPDDLTPDQTNALERALSQPVTYVWGPPGTGKTVVLAALAWQLFQENKRVLIVSHTNHAVDGVVESLCKRITERGRSAIPEGSILRLGSMVRESLIRQFGEQVHLESVMNRSHDKVSSRLDALRAELSQVRDSLFVVSRKLTLFESRKQLLSELEKTRRDARGADAGFVDAVRRVFQPAAEIGVRKANNSDEVSQVVELLETSVAEIAKELQGCNRESLQAQSVELSGRQLEVTEAIALLEKFVRDLKVSLLDRARILATTATHAMLTARELHTFDAVLIDEASMLPLPLCFLLSGLARDRVVIAGDFRQLPAIASSDSHVVRQWYARDVFDCAGIVDRVDAHQEHPALVTLSTQFRSRDTLCSLINDRFYGGILRTNPSNAAERFLFKEPLTYLNHSPIVLIDTAPLQPWGEVYHRSKSNLMHALIVRKISLLLSAHGAALSPDALGIISPYRAQANLIRELLQECALSQTVSVGTVHKYQGSERDAIVLDLTESSPHTLGSFLGSVSLRDTGARLLNVALSRARRYLIVVGNVEYLRSQLHSRHITWGVLDDLERLAYRLPVDELIGEPLFATPSREIREAPGVLAFQVFDEELFLPGLITDLLEASKEVVFSSPTFSDRVSNVLASLLEERIQKGLRVTLRIDGSRPLRGGEDAVLRRLQSIGMVVVRSEVPIPPAVVIDAEVLWLGSIAPFDSIAPSMGCMTRVVSPRAAHHALELLEFGGEGVDLQRVAAIA